MKENAESDWKGWNFNSKYYRAVTMHDKAHDRFRELNLDEKHDFLYKLAKHYKLPVFADRWVNFSFDDLKPASFIWICG